MLRPKEKCALNVNLSLRVWVCVHARTGLYIYGCDCVFLCFNVCCLNCNFFFFFYFFLFIWQCHKPWCDCSSYVYVPVWGHRTNTMNVDVVSFIWILIVLLQRSWVWFYFLLCTVVSSGAVKTEQWHDIFCLFVFLNPEADKNNTCFMDSSWHCESYHGNKTSVDYLNTVGRGGRDSVDPWWLDFVKGIEGKEFAEGDWEGGYKKYL